MSQTYHPKSLQQVLSFPECTFLVVGSGSLYFLPLPPAGEAKSKAYLVEGERRELMGKQHVKAKTESAAFKTYDITWEFEEGKLIAARLITPQGRSIGTAAGTRVLEATEAALLRGDITLETRQRPAAIYRVARFNDGRLLIMVNDMQTDRYGATLLLGTPGNYTQLEIASGIQGGGSFHFNLKDGRRIDLPSGLMGPSLQDIPAYAGEELSYLRVKDPLDLAAFGLASGPVATHYDPFHPGLSPVPPVQNFSADHKGPRC